MVKLTVLVQPLGFRFQESKHLFRRLSALWQGSPRIPTNTFFKMWGEVVWVEGYQSIHGCHLTLAKSVLMAIPAYAMQTTIIHSSLYDKIDRFVHDLIWGFSNNVKKKKKRTLLIEKICVGLPPMGEVVFKASDHCR